MENRELWLARTFVEPADTLVADFDVVDFLTMLASRCQQLFGRSEVSPIRSSTETVQGGFRSGAHPRHELWKE
jgi:hypothetical protein